MIIYREKKYRAKKDKDGKVISERFEIEPYIFNEKKLVNVRCSMTKRGMYTVTLKFDDNKCVRLTYHKETKYLFDDVVGYFVTLWNEWRDADKVDGVESRRINIYEDL
jgi:hypothetical protein